MDRLLDETRRGAFYLRQPAIAELIVEALHFNSEILEHYRLHAFVIMPNHLHLLATPAIALPTLMKSLKRHHGQGGQCDVGIDGQTFWQQEL
jgi:REP element-mobilizing transposase RayT